jgi:hypothetical protein
MAMTKRALLLLLLLSAAAEANEFVRVGGDIELPVPANWRLASDTADLPAQLVFYNDSAEILIFQSEIGKADMIADQEELRKSVDLVIDEVINTLPDGQLRVSSGFYEGFRTGFNLEFASRDSLTGVPLEHTIKGIIYRADDDRQLLFTVWGKAAAVVYPQVKDAIKLVQDGFAYRGEFEREVFATRSMSYWPLVLILLAILGLILLRPPWRKRSASGAPPKSE